MKRFKLIFFMSLILILILGTTSQASVSKEYMDYIWTNLENNTDFNNSGNYNTNFKSYLQQLTVEQKNSVKTKINQYLYANNLNYEDVNLNTFLTYNAETTFVIYFVFSNNTAPNNNDLGYLEIKNDNLNTTRIYIKNNNGTIKYLKVTVAYYNNNLHFTVSDFAEINSSGPAIKLGKTAYSENTEIFYSSNISCYKLTQVAYIGYPISAGNEETRFLRNYSAYINTDDGAYIPKEPDIDSGDSGGSTTPSGDGGGGGNTGTTTDLSKVENGIKDINNNLENIENKIPTSGDIKNATTNGIIDGNNQYWGNSGDLNGEKEQEEIQNIINEAMENVSGELSKNKVFKALENAEKGFFDLFKNKLEEQAYDLKFNWKKTEYEGATLLEDGEINISKMCREIPELARLQFYIRLIFNFTVIVNIIKQIYNLILATLGIDNPFLYEEGEQTTSIDTETGEYRQYYRNKKRKLW